MNPESTVTQPASATSLVASTAPAAPTKQRSARKRGGYRPRRRPLAGEHLRLMGPDPDATPGDAEHCVSSEDGNILVVLRGAAPAPHRTGRRLCVERVHRITPAEIISHLMLFEDERQFLDWCDTDPIRFRANVTQQVRRIGHELLELTR